MKYEDIKEGNKVQVISETLSDWANHKFIVHKKYSLNMIALQCTTDFFAKSSYGSGGGQYFIGNIFQVNASYIFPWEDPETYNIKEIENNLEKLIKNLK